MISLIMQCYQECKSNYNGFWEYMNNGDEIVLPKINEENGWKPEKAVHFFNSDELGVKIHPDLYSLYASVRYFSIQINRLNYCIFLNPLIEKRQGKQIITEFFFGLNEGKEFYYLLGYAEDQTKDYSLVLKNSDGTIWLLEKKDMIPLASSLSNLLEGNL